MKWTCFPLLLSVALTGRQATADSTPVPITFTEALTKRLQVMDSTAFSLCMDNKIPIVVFDMYKPGILRDAVLGRKVGTLVSDEAETK